MKHVSPEAPRGPVIPATASDGLAPVGGPGPAAPSYRKPQRRELSYRVAALAYTWAAIERRGR